ADKYTDLLEAGILDPTAVVRDALQNAAAIAEMLLGTETVVTSSPKTMTTILEPKKGKPIELKLPTAARRQLLRETEKFLHKAKPRSTVAVQLEVCRSFDLP